MLAGTEQTMDLSRIDKTESLVKSDYRKRTMQVESLLVSLRSRVIQSLSSRLKDRLRPLLAKRRRALAVADWEKRGRPVPPPHAFKQELLLEYSKRYSLRLLVETGTYMGDMVNAMRYAFDEIYSIELSEDLHSKAVRRFSGVKNVHLLQGDSGTRLGEIMPQLTRPTLFWLDGHYSAGVTARGEKDTPILDELEHIFRDSLASHVILIDDARCFVTDPAYPSVASVEASTRSRFPAATVTVADDVIRISLS